MSRQPKWNSRWNAWRECVCVFMLLASYGFEHAQTLIFEWRIKIYYSERYHNIKVKFISWLSKVCASIGCVCVLPCASSVWVNNGVLYCINFFYSLNDRRRRTTAHRHMGNDKKKTVLLCWSNIYCRMKADALKKIIYVWTIQTDRLLTAAVNWNINIIEEKMK